MKTKLNEMTYGELTNHARIVLDELRTKAYAEGYEQGKFDQRMETALSGIAKVANGVGVTLEKSAQEQRDEIVARAKADIEGLKDDYGEYYRVPDPEEMFSHLICKAEFIVNAEKRTVVALLRGVNTEKVRAKGIAKFAPNDCFNSHIGRAIALRRALGKSIPDEYLNAPQPTEVRVGDVVKSVCPSFPFWGNGKVADIEEFDGGPNRVYKADDGFNYLKHAKIIDDSREGEDDGRCMKRR